MRRFSGALAFVAGAALVASTTGAAIGQEESPPSGEAEAPEAAAETTGSEATGAAEPSTLTILDIAGHKQARAPLKGKKYKKAVAKAAPTVTSYLIDSVGADDIERIVELSQVAATLNEAGDKKGANAVIALATLLYRGAWSRAGSDHPSFYAEIEEFIKSGEYDSQDLSMAMWSLGDEGVQGVIDLCVWANDRWNMMGQPPESTICEDNGGRQIRVDFRESGAEVINSEYLEAEAPLRASQLLSTIGQEVDVVGIHTVVQDKTANDKLAGKKYKKAMSKALKKHGPTIAGRYYVDADASAEQRVIEYVLLAREADEAGAPKAAKAFMDLALAAYRSGVRKEGVTSDINLTIDALIGSDYGDAPGLVLFPLPGEALWCVKPDGSSCERMAGGDTMWECEGEGLKLKRLNMEEAEAAGCPIE